MKRLKDLKEKISQKLGLRLNKNQFQEVERLIFEITRRESSSMNTILKSLESIPKIDNLSLKNKFFSIKKSLLKTRFPQTSIHENLDNKKIFLNKLKPPLKKNYEIKQEFKPLKIFVEKTVSDSYLAKNFQKQFPKIKIEEIENYKKYLKNNRFTISELKKPFVFIVEEKWDFIKPCPCTKHHLRCGYWIFNLGFGCPFDCSYCYLQQYTNAPGIVLPANIEKFFTKFDKFHDTLKKPIRIGTGEFTDSLALDNITEYSKILIPYFQKKKVIFELKTKSSQISNILELKSSSNIVISWSLSPSEIIRTEEKGTASLNERLNSAKLVQQKGFNIAFHFDPIIHTQDWEKSYKKVIDKLYSNVKPPFAWISLGTLRSSRELKSINEIRFPKSNIFYGELFLGQDKKLRYPYFIRTRIYQKIIDYIKAYDRKTPVYLCMEDRETWKHVEGIVPFSDIEKGLVGE